MLEIHASALDRPIWSSVLCFLRKEWLTSSCYVLMFQTGLLGTVNYFD